jgi:hypothetical protein
LDALEEEEAVYQGYQQGPSANGSKAESTGAERMGTEKTGHTKTTRRIAEIGGR